MNNSEPIPEPIRLRDTPPNTDGGIDRREARETPDSLVQEIDRRTGVTPTRNEIDVVGDGPRAFHAIEGEIQRAQRSIHINVFSWAPDSTGNRLADQLINRARDGVQVTVQVDLFGSLFVGCKNEVQNYLTRYGWTLLPTLTRQLAASFSPQQLASLPTFISDPTAIQNLPPQQQETLQQALLSVFPNSTLLSLHPALRRLQTAPNVRLNIQRLPLAQLDHSKVFIFDETTVFSGGMNVGDDYSGGYHAQGGWNGSVRPQYWRDYLVRMSGPASAVHRNLFFGAREAMPPNNDARSRNAFVRVLHNRGGPSTPGAAQDREKQITFAIYHLLENAREEILVEHAYIMDDRVVDLLNAAAARGVDVRIFRSLPEDPTTERMNQRHFSRLRSSANLRIYQASEVLHTKLLCVDDRYSIIGSANLNRLSLEFHTETSLLLVGNQAQRNLTRGVRQRFDTLDAEAMLRGNPAG